MGKFIVDVEGQVDFSLGLPLDHQSHGLAGHF
jgi:hypothetical protein